MRGISEDDLWKIVNGQYATDGFVSVSLLINRIKELNTWKRIDENTPKDRLILVYAPCCDGLGYLITTCLWHDDAGFCIDMIREPTHWQELPTLPKENL